MSVFLRMEEDIAFVELDQADSKVNLLSADMLKKLEAVLDQAERHDGLRAVVFVSLKDGVFIAGADIKSFAGISNEEQGAAKAAAGQAVFNRIEDLPVPSIAVIDGAALGGGCELALACRYRIATTGEKVRIGLPEVQLGILPGFGGTYRLPRLVGLSQALTMILTGKLLSGKAALKAGLVDRLVAPALARQTVREMMADPAVYKSAPKGRRSRAKGLAQWLEAVRPGHALIFTQARRQVLKTTGGRYPAPLKALEVIARNFYLPRVPGLQLEAQALGQLVVTPESRHLVHVFHLQEHYKKLSLPGEVSAFQPRRSLVVGAGVMGGGIAQLLAYRDIDVRLKDMNAEAVARGLQAAAGVFRQAVRRRKLTSAAAEQMMARISWTTGHSGVSRADVVLEAVVEDLEVKKKVFAELGRLTGPETLLCTNTSALSVTEMAKASGRPERVVGFHFFNPVHRMPLVEVIRTPLSSPGAVADALALARRLGKTPILVKDAPGFLVNRILLSYINEAGLLWEEGADLETIDGVMTDFGMPMGPFRLSDEVGLDVGVKVLHILHQGLGERFRPAAVFDAVARAGLRGKKSSQGFYLHRGRTGVNPAVRRLVQRRGGKVPASDECLNRMLLVMIQEAARCLGEKIVDGPRDVDAGMIWGTGFPPFLGGLLRHADQWGMRTLMERLKFFAWQGEGYSRFEPCSYIQDLERERRGFYVPAGDD